MSSPESGLPRGQYEGLKPEDVIERLAPPDKIDWETGLYKEEVLLESLTGFMAEDDPNKGLYATGITIDGDLSDESLRTLGVAILSTRDLLRRPDLPARTGDNSFVVMRPYLKADPEIEQAIFAEEEDRMYVATGTMVKGLPYLRWNSTFLKPGDTPETFLERAHPSGSHMDLTRSHRQGSVEKERVKQLAWQTISRPRIRRVS